MSTSYEDIHYEEYLREMEEGYNEAVSKVAMSKNMKELSVNLESLQKFLRQYDEIVADNANIQSLKESASAFETIQEIVHEVKPSKWKIIAGIVGSFLLGVLTNIVSNKWFGS